MKDPEIPTALDDYRENLEEAYKEAEANWANPSRKLLKFILEREGLKYRWWLPVSWQKKRAFKAIINNNKQYCRY
jgi:hypothetical protein